MNIASMNQMGFDCILKDWNSASWNCKYLSVLIREIYILKMLYVGEFPVLQGTVQVVEDVVVQRGLPPTKNTFNV